MLDKTKHKWLTGRSPHQNQVTTRRGFLKNVRIVALAGTALGATASLLEACSTERQKAVTANTAIIPNTKKKINLDDEIEVSLEKWGIRWTPDVHLSYVTFTKENIRRFFLTGNGGKTYLLEGKASDDLASLINKTPSGKLPELWGPDKFSDNKYGYSAIASVLQIDKTNLYHLIGFTHNEQHAGPNPSSTFTASISELRSFDGGKTWQQVGNEPVIKGDDFMPPGMGVSGAGQPCAIVKDGYVYVYYIDWARKHVHHSDQIYLARAKIEADGKLGAYEFYKGNAFQFQSVEKNLAPVIPTPNNKFGSYVALPSISYNIAIKQLLGVVELNGAFGITTSTNGIQWAMPQPLIKFTPHSQVRSGEDFISYPTLISTKEVSDATTDEAGYLIYAKGSPHNMVMRQFTLS